MTEIVELRVWLCRSRRTHVCNVCQEQLLTVRRPLVLFAAGPMSISPDLSDNVNDRDPVLRIHKRLERQRHSIWRPLRFQFKSFRVGHVALTGAVGADDEHVFRLPPLIIPSSACPERRSGAPSGSARKAMRALSGDQVMPVASVPTRESVCLQPSCPRQRRRLPPSSTAVVTARDLLHHRVGDALLSGDHVMSKTWIAGDSGAGTSSVRLPSSADTSHRHRIRRPRTATRQAQMRNRPPGSATRAGLCRRHPLQRVSAAALRVHSRSNTPATAHLRKRQPCALPISRSSVPSAFIR